jgi:O-methyltransferase
MNRIRNFLRPRRAREQAEEAVASAPLLGVDPADFEITQRCAPYTMTSPERVVAVLDAVDYCVRRGLPGAFAECGVWRGGSVLAIVLKLQSLGFDDRELYLYDTFEGMTRPSEHDTSTFDPPALATWEAAEDTGSGAWDYLFAAEVFNEDMVRDLLVSTGYPAARLHLVKGPVESTLPAAAPDQLALLRLDTDWYESTKHELEHLYPRLVPGGVLVIDDYGHWEGCRRAVDEYFTTRAAPVLLNRIDYTGRIAVKS